MIYLLTDSTACISRKEAREMGVILIPMGYTRDGKDAFQEGYIEESVAWAKNWQDLSPFSTSQVSTSSFLDVFLSLKEQGHQALCLTISSRLSGTYQNAVKAAEEAGEGFYVLDSRTTAGGLYLMLRQARQRLNEGMAIEDVMEELRAMRRLSHTIFTIQDMNPLRRSGRLGYVRSSVSTLLNLRPLLMLQDGSVVSHSLARGKQDQLRQMLLGLSGNPREVIIQECGDEEAADALEERMREKGLEVIRRQIGIVLAIHLGLPVLSIAWVESKEAAN
ncbi:MAG: DegV family protein [Bacillota bacterium]|nr:DegV family protein [Bacillota bacterium]